MKEEFKAQFFLPSNGFHEPVDLTDTEIGFSVFKDRPQPGFKSLFRIYVKKEGLVIPSPLKPLTIVASYGKETKNGLVVSSSEFKRERNWPIDLISEDEFFYNIQTHKLFNKSGKNISGLDILQEVDKLHTKPTRLFSGFILRTQLFWYHKVFAVIFKSLFDIFSGLQYLISGKKIHIFENFTDPNNRSEAFEFRDLKVTRGKPIRIFEYEVEPWIAALYCIFHFVVFAVFYSYRYNPSWLKTVFENNFLTTLYGILSLGLANSILPTILRPNNTFKWILILFQKLYIKCISKKFRI
ncbi:MAG: hypothetical protein Q7K16_02270 [Candidatus Azambacteria bacterium]|nr:hypothetical protein [Candidatus Azambacteria bacterium]